MASFPGPKALASVHCPRPSLQRNKKRNEGAKHETQYHAPIESTPPGRGKERGITGIQMREREVLAIALNAVSTRFPRWSEAPQPDHGCTVPDLVVLPSGPLTE